MTILNLKQAYCKLDKDQRFYRLNRPLIGITGGIATGKSTCSKYLINKGYPLIDADGLVKSIYQENETIEFIQNIDTKYIQDGAIDFKKLRRDVFQDKDLKARIETYIYQKLPSAFQLVASSLEKKGALLYDIPLLFEKDLAAQFDLTLCIYVDEKLQIERLLKRDGISEDEAKRILSQQMPISKKAELSDFKIDNSSNIEDLYHSIEHWLQEISE